MAYTGTIYRGVDYSPTWSGWAQNPGNTQTNDSDFANDAFASLWGSVPPQTAPPGDPSVPVNNGTNYRDDLGTIQTDGFHLVRLYNWDPARGTASTPGPYPPANGAPALPATSDVGLDHLNFLNYATTQKLKIVVPVSDYFISNGFQNGAWGGTTPDSKYSFDKAPLAIQDDFKQFIASITDPTTGKIHAAIQSIDVGNEGDLATALTDGTTASQFLARTNWWIYNLHQQINGTTPVDGNPVVNGSTGAIIPITATISNADQGATSPGGWWNDLINGVSPTILIPLGYAGWQNPQTLTNLFTAPVTGLSAVDPGYASYYYNSVNISQGATGLAATLAVYDSGGSSSAWPFKASNVPLMLMEVFTPTQLNATAAVAQATAIEAYLQAHNAGTSSSTTNVMGYNYYEFNNEPTLGLAWGLYNYTGTPQNADTGTTTTFYGAPAFPDITFPVDTLTAAQGPGGAGTTLWQAWTDLFPATYQGTASNDTLVGTAAAETFRGGPGTDSIDGGGGNDIALYGGNANGYTLKATAGSATITVQDKVGTDGTDILTNIEQVRFVDGASLPTAWQITTASLPAAQILKVVDLYTAGLGRAPDALGLDYWASQLANGASIKDISNAIFSSPEAAATYSSANSNPTLVNLAYQSAFGRSPDAAGAAYWANELNTGHLQRTDLVTALIAGASGADKQYVVNTEAVGAHFALTQGLNNVTSAKAVEALVNGTAASVTAANAQTDAFAATAATAAGTELVVQIVGIVP